MVGAGGAAGIHNLNITWSLVAVSHLCGSTPRNGTGVHWLRRWMGPTAGLDAL
jgi:hypothetical protein